jgi:hypothetical protein
MHQDRPEVRGNKTIKIVIELEDEGVIEITHYIDEVNTSVGAFHDSLQKMIEDASYKRIECVLR